MESRLPELLSDSPRQRLQTALETLSELADADATPLATQITVRPEASIDSEQLTRVLNLLHKRFAEPIRVTLVPIRRLAAISPLKTLGIARLRPWTRLCASVWSEVSASHGLCHAAVRIAGLHPSWNQDYILWPIFLLSNYCYHVISSCCASSCTPARAGGP